MQTIKKVILVVICLVVLLTSFLTPVAAVDTIDSDSLPPCEPTPYQDIIDVFGPYYMMPLIDQVYAFLASDDFGINDYVYSTGEFIYYEDLPYGMDTVVVGFRLATNALYLFFMDSSVPGTVIQRWSDTGYCNVTVRSSSPIYRIGFSLKSSNLISFSGYTGLIDTGTYVEPLGRYQFNYTFIAGDFYNIVTPNYKKNILMQCIPDTNVSLTPLFGVGKYPLRADYEAALQKEQNETSKGIWDSIKELPSKIADSISGLFDKLINYLLYFQETKPEHVNPFADILTDVKSFFNDQMSDVGDFKNSLSSTLNNVVTYIETGSGVVNTFLTAVPMLSAFITFFVVFCIVRKVIGR